MKADAIIFDKDGTLMDFEAFWVTVSLKALEDLLHAVGRSDIPVDAIMQAFGVRNGVMDINGILCRGTFAEMAECIQGVLQTYECERTKEELLKLTVDTYRDHFDAGEIRPVCDGLAETLAELRKQNKKLAVVTTDNEEGTMRCLRKLGIVEQFDWIYTDNGVYPPKPNPFCADDFCKRVGISKDRLIMVGDTYADIEFAKNAGIPVVGVAKAECNRRILAEQADAVLPDVSHIFEVLD